MSDKNSKNPHHHEEPARRDMDALADHIKNNPVLYVVGAVFIVLAFVAGFMVQASNLGKQREAAASLIQALETEDPALRVVELQTVAATGGRHADEALYLAAESALRAQNHEEAKALFGQLRTDHPQSRFVPDAVEGLGYAAEEAGDYAQALAYYQEVLEKWSLTFAGRRQEINIGRMHEQLGQYEEAALAYQSQQQTFPDSAVAFRARLALDELAAAHPEVAVEAATTPFESPAAPESLTDALPVVQIEDEAVSDLTAEPEQASDDETDAVLPDGEALPNPEEDAPEPTE